MDVQSRNDHPMNYSLRESVNSIPLCLGGMSTLNPLEAKGSDGGYSSLPIAQAHGDSAALPNDKLSSADHGGVSWNKSVSSHSIKNENIAKYCKAMQSCC